MNKYEWYELITDSENITQGDIIENCIVASLVSIVEEGNKTQAKAIGTKINGIVLTQSCDIEQGKLKNIILCPISFKNEFVQNRLLEGNNEKQIKKDLEGISKGAQHAFHLLNKCELDDYVKDYMIVNFKEIYSIPLDLIKKIAKENNKRLRLCSPYREHLSQAFARYFMRVGLPAPIDLDDLKS